MPPGTPFRGFIHPYSIRVDEFSCSPEVPSAKLFMLSHTHTDHIVGLNAKSFSSKILCSRDAKAMLLAFEPLKERLLKDRDLVGEERSGRAFGHLAVKPVCVGTRVDYAGSRDLLMDGIRDFLKLVDLMPCNTVFFINSWTWGYEDIIIAMARFFNCKACALRSFVSSSFSSLCQVHVDRYKHVVYSRIADEALQASITLDAASTHLHACERFDRCEYAPKEGTVDGKPVVYINPVTFSVTKWTKYMQETMGQLKANSLPSCLLVPLARHSALPELKSFVSLFRPRSIIPNTLDTS
ncbi:hypothetical protein K488DRAFT_11731, partial [Vararia minispora EC-137]